MNDTPLSPEEQKALVRIITIIGIVLAILVFIIMMARIIFWISIVLFFCSIAYLIIGGIIDIHRIKKGDDFDVAGLPHFLLAIGIMGLFWVVAHFSFPVGYSEFSYQILEWNEEYKEFSGLPFQVTIEALNQTCSSLPTYQACGTILNSYESVEKINGISNVAKLIQGIFNLKFK